MSTQEAVAAIAAGPPEAAEVTVFTERQTVSVSTPIERVHVGAFRIPTASPESDGTLAWDATTLVVVELGAGTHHGLGYTYASPGVASLVSGPIEEVLLGRDAGGIDALWHVMFARLRNLGRQGATAMAVSAVDAALWDLKARLLEVPLVQLLGAVRETLPVYGSGGFTSYSDSQLSAQFEEWAAQGVSRFKMKVGREPARDSERVRAARRLIGQAAELYVDGNGAYTPRRAVEWGTRFACEHGVTWFEQPLPPENLPGLRFVREHVPAALEIADGEYGYDLDYFSRLLASGAVDVVMADVTRCGGITGFRKVATLCEAAMVPLSTHCAPALHLHVGCATAGLRHAEYFHDHARIEQVLFDGLTTPEDGALRPDLAQPGMGLEFKWSDAQRFAV